MRLAEVIEIRKGKKPAAIVSEPFPDARRLLQIEDLRPHASLKYCPPMRDEVVAQPTDVVIAWDGANAGTVSFGLQGVIGSTLALLRPKQLSVWTPYLGHFLRSRSTYLRERCNGATVPHIDSNVLGNLELRLPSLAEQRRIAEVLDRAEALRAKRRAALAQIESLNRSLFLELFDNPIAKGWRMTTVAEVAKPVDGSIRTGPFGSQLLHSEFTVSGIPVLGIDNAVANKFRWAGRRFISDGKYRQLKRYTVHPQDVLITIMGTCGRCAIVPDDVPTCINTKHLCCITLDQEKCLPAF